MVSEEMDYWTYAAIYKKICDMASEMHDLAENFHYEKCEYCHTMTLARDIRRGDGKFFMICGIPGHAMSGLDHDTYMCKECMKIAHEIYSTLWVPMEDIDFVDEEADAQEETE